MGASFPREDVTNIFYLGYSISGEEFWIDDEKWDAQPQDYELGKKFLSLCEKLIEEGKIKGHPVRMLEGGLEGILGGMGGVEAKDG